MIPLKLLNIFRFLPVLVFANYTLSQDLPWHLQAGMNDNAPASISSSNLRPGPSVINVAVIDSGIIKGHPSLVGRLLPGYDMISEANNLRGARSGDFSPDQRNSKCKDRVVSSSSYTHGTEVASLIAGNGEYGVYGVNVNALVVPIKVFGACGTNRKDLLDALAWAAGWRVIGASINKYPAKVINLSIAGGFSSCGEDLQNVVNNLVKQGIFIVASAGNNFHKRLQEPANCHGVISVGAVDANNQVEIYTALDPRTVVYAPGGGRKLSGTQNWTVNKLKIATYDQDFLGSERSTGEWRGIGTSFAAPIVAGFISLWLSYHPDKLPVDFLDELPNFFRSVESSPDCLECKPASLNAALFK